MKTITAAELQANAEQVLDKVQREHLAIVQNERTVAVIISHQEYMRFIGLENHYWMGRANAAEQSGYIGPEATAEFIKSMVERSSLDG